MLGYLDDFRDVKDRKCHVCGTEVPFERFEKDDVKVQVFTGRVFCTDECWDEYLKGEGLA